MFEILSLDGGGTWALIQARAIERIFGDVPGREILEHFDLSIANSGGSIVLAALAADMTPGHIAEMFLSPAGRADLYGSAGIAADLFGGLGIVPRWSTAHKLAGIRARLGHFGATKMTDLVGRIAICAYDLDRSSEVIFRSYRSPLEPAGAFVPTLAEAVGASSNAPILYFDAPQVIENQATPGDVRRFWDGACGSYNCPAAAGLCEARAIGEESIDVLSIGTGLTWRPVGIDADNLYQRQVGNSQIAAIQAMARAPISAPAEAALRQVEAEAFITRLSPILKPDGHPGAWTIPAWGADGRWERIMSMDMDVTEQRDVDLLNDICTRWLAGEIPNQPTLMHSVTAEMIAGYPIFAEGAQWWRPE